MSGPLWHLDCVATVEFLGDPTEPPDPDRHGNRREPYRCPACGERATVVTATYGGELFEPGYAPEAEIEWTVPLPADGEP